MLSTYFSKATYINSTHSLSNENRIFHIRIIQFNRSKGAQGPDEWVPPSGQCGYVARFVRIVKQYDLKPTKPEARWLKAFLERCRS